MTAFIELRCKPDARAFIDAGSIAGILTSKNGRADVVSTPESPMTVILRAGETLEVYGESPAELLVRMTLVRKEVRENGLDIKCAFIDGNTLGHDQDTDLAAPHSHQ